MQRRISIYILFVLLLPDSKHAYSQNSHRTPNIIFILADDLGWAELACYGNTFNRTPHLNRLAGEGMKFTQAYAAAPVCSPTRAALLSGQYPARLGIIDYLGPHEPDKFFKPELTTLNDVLHRQGYATGLIGKWHLTGDYKLKRGEPARHGWHEVICSETSYIADGDYFAPYAFMPDVQPTQEGEYLTDRLTEEAIGFIQRNQKKPFFLYLSHYSVHTKLAPKPEVAENYSTKPAAGQQKNNPALAAMLETLDEGVGRILETLAELKLSDHTIIVFTSDNGGETRVTTNGNLRSGKSFLYEGGLRVPLIVKWPGVTKAGAESDVPVITQDFYPTLIEAAGATANREQVMDGVSIIKLLKGQKKMKRNELYWHYPLRKPHFLGGTSAGAIRWKNYKLIEFFDTGKMELYDLATDPSESRDLAGALPKRASDLKNKLHAWRKQVNAEMYQPVN